MNSVLIVGLIIFVTVFGAIGLYNVSGIGQAVPQVMLNNSSIHSNHTNLSIKEQTVRNSTNNIGITYF